MIDYISSLELHTCVKKISYTRSALKTLRKMPVPTRERIKVKIEAYAAAPASQANNVRALKGRTGIRLRVGDWRVIMDDEGAVLAVLEVGPRGGVYS